MQMWFYCNKLYAGNYKQENDGRHAEFVCFLTPGIKEETCQNLIRDGLLCLLVMVHRINVDKISNSKKGNIKEQKKNEISVKHKRKPQLI